VLNWYPLVLVVIASVLKVAFSARLVWGVFGGRARSDWAARFHAPGKAMQLPPLLLASACLVFGLFPGVLGTALDALWTPGLHHPERLHFSVWHGVSREFVMSTLIVLAGLGLYALLQGGRWTRLEVPAPLRFDAGFEGLVAWLPAGAKLLGRLLRFDRQFDYLAVSLGFTVLLVGGYGWSRRTELWPGLPAPADFDLLRSFVVLLIAVAVGMVMHMKRWTSQLIAVSIVGFLVTFYYVLFRAPDLAMTQILVESATLLLVLLLLARFPRSAELSEATRAFSRRRQGLNVLIATGMGVLATLVVLMGMRHRHAAAAGEHYLDHTVPLAHGTNAVNTILVDFRGFDTLLEITVLVIACLGSLGLLMRYRRTAEELAAGAMGPAGYGLGRSKPAPEAEGKKP
jgi:multisubunit Na+/H+ antiporter MnhB subunit